MSYKLRPLLRSLRKALSLKSLFNLLWNTLPQFHLDVSPVPHRHPGLMCVTVEFLEATGTGSAASTGNPVWLPRSAPGQRRKLATQCEPAGERTQPAQPGTLRAVLCAATCIRRCVRRPGSRTGVHSLQGLSLPGSLPTLAQPLGPSIPWRSQH